jgi:hypothetical protein
MKADADLQKIALTVNGVHRVSALLQTPPRGRACLVLAHGAGAGMAHPFMQGLADGLAAHGIATLRYQFPYMERGSKRPDPPTLAQATVRAATAEAARRLPNTAIFAGGKSFGGRMTSQAQAAEPLPSVRGLIFFGFPLHAPGKPSGERGEHLSAVRIPMLFLQGTRDEFADLGYLGPLVKELGKRARLQLLDHANHSFAVPARSGRTDSEVMTAATSAVSAWIGERLG